MLGSNLGVEVYRVSGFGQGLLGGPLYSEPS